MPLREEKKKTQTKTLSIASSIWKKKGSFSVINILISCYSNALAKTLHENTP